MRRGKTVFAMVKGCLAYTQYIALARTIHRLRIVQCSEQDAFWILLTPWLLVLKTGRYDSAENKHDGEVKETIDCDAVTASNWQSRGLRYFRLMAFVPVLPGSRVCSHFKDVINAMLQYHIASTARPVGVRLKSYSGVQSGIND